MEYYIVDKLICNTIVKIKEKYFMEYVVMFMIYRICFI